VSNGERKMQNKQWKQTGSVVTNRRLKGICNLEENIEMDISKRGSVSGT